MNVLQILEHGAASSGGSGTGCSHYLSMCGCHLRHTLDERARLRGEERRSGFDADVGTFYHLFQEYYWNKALDSETAFEVNDLAMDPMYDAFQEALRLFRYYRNHVVTPEMRDAVTVLGTELLLPRDANEAAKLEQKLGVPWTGRIDLLLEFDEAAVELWQENRIGLADLEPGVWVWDFKTKKRTPSNTAMEYGFGSLQMPSYQIAVAECLGVDVKGAGLDFAIRLKGLKKECYPVQLVDPPSQSQREILKERFISIKENYERSPEAPTGLGVQCVNWGRLCKHALSGDCKWGQL